RPRARARARGGARARALRGGGRALPRVVRPVRPRRARRGRPRALSRGGSALRGSRRVIDLALLRENPERYRRGAARKRVAVDVDRVLALDAERRRLQLARSEERRVGKECELK